MPIDEPPSRDHFAPVAASYAAFRPRYPADLYEWLAEVSPGRERAWDCACGSGQATLDLARRFTRVDATDFSQAQLDEAPAHPRVTYRVAAAEASGFDAAIFDLVTVAQALHWFDATRFYAEARRVLRPGGVLAVWSYAMCSIPAAAGDAMLQHYYHDIVGPYWPAERRHVEDGYLSLGFPTPQLQAPAYTIEVDWTLAQLTGYVRSWSATARYAATHGSDPVAELERALGAQWGDPAARRRVRWPMIVRAAVLGVGG